MRIREENCPNCGAPLPPHGPCASCGTLVRGSRQGLNCPNCGAPLSPEGNCTSCGATVRGFYRGLDLGRVDIASAVEQGLDYYLLLGIKPDSKDLTIQAAYRRLRSQFPPDTSRLVRQLAQRLELIEQAGYILCDPQRRTTYDDLRQARLRRQTHPQDEATRGMICFRTGRFNDAARLLRIAMQHSPADENLYLSYVLSLIYGSSNLASPEDWRIDEMMRAIEQAIEATSGSPAIQAHRTLCQALHHYDKGRFAEGWQLMAELNRSSPRWHLPWVVSAYWYRREGNLGALIACAERARRLQPDDRLIADLMKLMRRVWSTSPSLLPNAARRAVELLADDTPVGSIEAAWRQP